MRPRFKWNAALCDTARQTPGTLRQGSDRIEDAVVRAGSLQNQLEEMLSAAPAEPAQPAESAAEKAEPDETADSHRVVAADTVDAFAPDTAEATELPVTDSDDASEERDFFTAGEQGRYEGGPGTIAPVALEPEEPPRPVIVRTPAQDARRALFIRGVVVAVGGLIAVLAFGAMRSRAASGATSAPDEALARPNAPALAIADNAALAASEPAPPALEAVPSPEPASTEPETSTAAHPTRGKQSKGSAGVHLFGGAVTAPTTQANRGRRAALSIERAPYGSTPTSEEAQVGVYPFLVRVPPPADAPAPAAPESTPALPPAPTPAP